MKSRDDENFRFVMFSVPMLKSWIRAWEDVSVDVSIDVRFDICLRSAESAAAVRFSSGLMVMTGEDMFSGIST